MARNNTTSEQPNRKSLKVLAAAVVVAAVGLALVWFKVGSGRAGPTSELATFEAKRGPLTISVPESGTIKAREQLIIYNEVEGRTSIISLVREGTPVKKGDLLVKLDSSTLDDGRIDQEIRVRNAEAAFINARESLAIVKNQAQSDIDVAKLNLDFAKLDLQKYTDPNGGQWQNDRKAAENSITVAEEEKTRADETLTWSERLFGEKYISLTEVQADRLSVTRSKVKLELMQNEATLLKKFTYNRQIAKLESDVNQAEMALERAQRKATANVAQAEADLSAKQAEYQRQQDKLKKTEDQVGKTTILSPADGVVIYATTGRRGGPRFNEQPMEEGQQVIERQELIYLPVAASSMAEVAIHEASLEKVRVGLPAVVTVDAIPGKRFLGSVHRISPLPNAQSRFLNPDLTVYTSEIYIDGDHPDLRTGMSCKAEIIVEQYEDAVYVPVQAVMRVGGKPTVYIVKDGTVEPRAVEIGLDNNRMVRIISGLKEGETVSLTPPLRSGALEQTLQMPGASTGSTGTPDAIKQQIRAKLDANGAQTARPAASAEASAEEPASGGPSGRTMRGSDREAAGLGQDQAQQGQPPSGEQMEKMRQRFENMSPEERQKEMEKMKQTFQNMPAEEREKMRQQRSQGDGQSDGTRGRGQGRNQGGGQGRGQDQSQGQGQGRGGNQ